MGTPVTSLSDQFADMDPAAYAPYRSPRDYILSWTDELWIDKGIGRLGEHYAPDIKVHTAYGETYGFDGVIPNCVQKMSAFPNGGGGHGEDVVWESRGRAGFISSHRVLKTGTNSGYWTYGAPTGKHWISRTVAHCVVQDGRIVEEWLTRDEFAVLESLGLDPFQIAADLVAASPNTGEALSVGATGAFAGTYPQVVRHGISGERPQRFDEACETVVAFFDEVWNARRFDLVSRHCDRKIVAHTVRMRRVQGHDHYQQDIIDLLAAFPDGWIEVRDLVANESEDLGLRVACIWVLHATYCGVPVYGAPTRTPVKILGSSHFEFKDGKILREFRIYDEVAVIAQIIAGRGGL